MRDLFVHVDESEGNVLRGFSKCIIWYLPDRREKVLPSLEVDEVRFEVAAILAAFSELTGTHLCCRLIGGVPHVGAIGAVAFTAEQLVSVACRRWAECEEVAELGCCEVKLG